MTVNPFMTDIPLADVLRSLIGAAYGEARYLDEPDMTPAARLARLEALDEVLAHGRADIADARASVISAEVSTTSTRAAAVALGLSPSAVAKAVARRRALDQRSAGHAVTRE